MGVSNLIVRPHTSLSHLNIWCIATKYKMGRSNPSSTKHKTMFWIASLWWPSPLDNHTLQRHGWGGRATLHCRLPVEEFVLESKEKIGCRTPTTRLRVDPPWMGFLGHSRVLGFLVHVASIQSRSARRRGAGVCTQFFPSVSLR